MAYGNGDNTGEVRAVDLVAMTATGPLQLVALVPPKQLQEAYAGTFSSPRRKPPLVAGPTRKSSVPLPIRFDGTSLRELGTAFQKDPDGFLKNFDN